MGRLERRRWAREAGSRLTYDRVNVERALQPSLYQHAAEDVDDVLVVLRGALHEAALPVDALALGHLQLHLSTLFRQIGLVADHHDGRRRRIGALQLKNQLSNCLHLLPTFRRVDGVDESKGVSSLSELS
ncbi:hypothetical protein TYRP_018443 [Tyrophagus putrescentiae]|nr:hypothetical protein TYRP_018443 [Tyrophagus putrescentiae]